MIDALGQFQALFPGAWVVLALAALPVGYLAGVVHFRTLDVVAHRLVSGDMTAVFLQVARLAVLGGLLWVFAMFGASALIAGAGGVLLARGRVLARCRNAK
ncbi:ATP synthase subunit I [Thalassovita taeanensis]|uniref:N-ATPase, AtpR subunit n=1 Tax=Thalassovita taeanensis TaxID=657014 RepID=A0A1H9HC38_9RHOB|nr:ATP synthase subunit I [Thalassovita taeanensis]SEQ59808.1 N-ATPase, AtpR subunit [Thalassovita taeanensis]